MGARRPGAMLCPWLVAACGSPSADADAIDPTVASFGPADTGSTAGPIETGDASTSAPPVDDATGPGTTAPATSDDATTSSTASTSDGGTTDATTTTPVDTADPTESTGAVDPFGCIDGDLQSALGDGIVVGDITGVGDDVAVDCADGGGDDLVYTWTAPADGTYTFDTSGSDYDSALAIRDGTCDAEQLACNDDTVGVTSELVVDVAAGHTILLVVDGWSGRTGPFVLDINAGAPSGSTCVDGGDLGSALGVVAMGSTLGASDSRTVECGADGPDVIYGWTAPADGDYTFSLNGSSYDTLLALWSPDCYGAPLACNDNVADGAQSEIVASLVAGQPIVVIVDGFLGDAGEYVLSID